MRIVVGRGNGRLRGRERRVIRLVRMEDGGQQIMSGRDDGIERVQNHGRRVRREYGFLYCRRRWHINCVDGRILLLVIEIFQLEDSLRGIWDCVSRNIILLFLSPCRMD